MAARAKKDVTPTSVKEAYLSQGETGAVRACILKYAETIDAKDSARDMKPLISGLFEAIDRLKAIESRDGKSNADTALFKILKAANE